MGTAVTSYLFCPIDGSLILIETFLPSFLNACDRPMVFVVFPSPYFVGVIAVNLGIDRDYIENYGKYMAKISLKALDKGNKNGKPIFLTTGIKYHVPQRSIIHVYCSWESYLLWINF